MFAIYIELLRQLRIGPTFLPQLAHFADKLRSQDCCKVVLAAFEVTTVGRRRQNIAGFDNHRICGMSVLFKFF